MLSLKGHRGYEGFVMYEDGVFAGQIIGLPITFKGNTLEEAQAGFEEAVDYYLDNR